MRGHHAHDRAGARHAGRLGWAFAVTAGLLVAEAVGGLLTGSLALVSDAGHMLTDAAGLGMALAAIHLASRAGRLPGHSFGLYRLEILAALANAVLLVGVGISVVVEAVRRLGEPAEVAAVPALVVAVAGLVANLIAFWLLRPGAAESINVEGAYLEVLADLAGSVVVIVSAAVVAATGFTWVDAVAGGLLGVWILPRTFSLGRRALRVLLQAAPPEIPLEQLTADLSALPGVVDVHDVHVWTLTSDMEVATAHVMVAPGTDTHAVLDQARVLLRDRYGIAHATVQVEPEDHRGCDEITW